MKSYKLVNSQEVQEKAFRLGYELFKPDSDISLEKDCLMFTEEGIFYTRNKPWCYKSMDYQEITQKDFLALPEPIKKGDWVKCSVEGWVRILKVESMNDNIFRNNTYGAALPRDTCTKLTSEQIEILGLEE